MKDNWNNNAIQFPRLIAELEAVGAFTPAVMRRLREETDMMTEDIAELTERAQKIWDRIKERT